MPILCKQVSNFIQNMTSQYVGSCKKVKPQEKHKNEEQIIMLKDNLITSSKPPLRSIFLDLYMSCDINIKLQNKITDFSSTL